MTAIFADSEPEDSRITFFFFRRTGLRKQLGDRGLYEIITDRIKLCFELLEWSLKG